MTMHEVYYPRSPENWPDSMPRMGRLLLMDGLGPGFIPGVEQPPAQVWLLTMADLLISEDTTRIRLPAREAARIMTSKPSAERRNTAADWPARGAVYIEFDETISFGGFGATMTLHGIAGRPVRGHEREVMILGEQNGELGSTIYRYNSRWQRIGRVMGRSILPGAKRTLEQTTGELLRTLSDEGTRLEREPRDTNEGDLAFAWLRWVRD